MADLTDAQVSEGKEASTRAGVHARRERERERERSDTKPHPTTPQKEKVALLTSMQLPEEQAIKSVKTDVGEIAASAVPTSIYAMLKIKEGADIAAVTEHATAYAKAAATSKGKIASKIIISDGEVIFIEVREMHARMRFRSSCLHSLTLARTSRLAPTRP